MIGRRRLCARFDRLQFRRIITLYTSGPHLLQVQPFSDLKSHLLSYRSSFEHRRFVSVRLPPPIRSTDFFVCFESKRVSIVNSPVRSFDTPNLLARRRSSNLNVASFQIACDQISFASNHLDSHTFTTPIINYPFMFVILSIRFEFVSIASSSIYSSLL